MADTRPWPVELRLKRDERVLEIEFDDGSQFRLPAELHLTKRFFSCLPACCC